MLEIARGERELQEKNINSVIFILLNNIKMRILRLTNDVIDDGANLGVIDTDFQTEVEIKANSKVALLNCTFNIANTSVIIDGDNNLITYQLQATRADGSAGPAEARLPSGEYGDGGHPNLLDQIGNTLNDSLSVNLDNDNNPGTGDQRSSTAQGQDKVIGLQWKGQTKGTKAEIAFRTASISLGVDPDKPDVKDPTDWAVPKATKTTPVTSNTADRVNYPAGTAPTTNYDWTNIGWQPGNAFVPPSEDETDSPSHCQLFSDSEFNKGCFQLGFRMWKFGGGSTQNTLGSSDLISSGIFMGFLPKATSKYGLDSTGAPKCTPDDFAYGLQVIMDTTEGDTFPVIRNIENGTTHLAGDAVYEGTERHNAYYLGDGTGGVTPSPVTWNNGVGSPGLAGGQVTTNERNYNGYITMQKNYGHVQTMVYTNAYFKYLVDNIGGGASPNGVGFPNTYARCIECWNDAFVHVGGNPINNTNFPGNSADDTENTSILKDVVEVLYNTVNDNGLNDGVNLYPTFMWYARNKTNTEATQGHCEITQPHGTLDPWNIPKYEELDLGAHSAEDTGENIGRTPLPVRGLSSGIRTSGFLQLKTQLADYLGFFDRGQLGGVYRDPLSGTYSFASSSVEKNGTQRFVSQRDLVSSNNYLNYQVRLLTKPLMGYNGQTGTMESILGTIPSAVNTTGMVQWEARTINKVQFRNPSEESLRNIKVQILTADGVPVAFNGFNVIVLGLYDD